MKPRTIAPSFWEDLDVIQLSRDERLLMVAMITAGADDHGRLKANPAYLKRLAFAFDADIGIAEVEAMIRHLGSSCKNVQLYEAGGELYACFANWEKYQAIKYKAKSLLPAPEDGRLWRGSADSSKTAPISPKPAGISETVATFPFSPLGSVGLGSVVKGSVGLGGDVPGASAPGADAPDPVEPADLDDTPDPEPEPPPAPPIADDPPSENRPRPRANSDPRHKRPAICAVRAALGGKYPPRELWDEIIAAVGETPDDGRLAGCRREWVARGYNPQGWGWLLEWYREGIPKRPGGNGHRQRLPRAFASLKEWSERGEEEDDHAFA
ncbi:MAG: hypothetical protein GXY76_16835 [Chloroflexi bacterium]|nr:hypothetical protein [Chloroflexota bacterium]